MKKKPYITGIAVVLILSSGPLASFAGDSKEEVTKLLAETYLASGQHEKAIGVYRDILQKEPFNIEARIKLAELLSWVKLYDEAIKEYGRVLELDPGNIKALKGSAEVHYWKGDLDKAGDIYARLIALDPQDNDIYVSYGEILTWQKKYSEAIAVFGEALKDGRQGRSQLMYGRALLYSGQYQLAEDVFVEYLRKNPGDTEAKIYLADTYAYSKRFGEAIDLYEDVLADNQDIAVKEKLGDVLSWDKQYGRALDLYDEILSEKYSKRVHRQKARVTGWDRRYEEALAEYADILKKEYDKVIELEMQAKRYYWNGRVKSAISKFNELITKEPGNLEAMFDLSQIYSYQSMWQEALAQYREILRENPNHFRAAEGLQKAELISGHVLLDTYYRYFESDSPSRDADVRKHQLVNNVRVPLGKRSFIETDYILSGREFSDFENVVENEGRFKITYLDKPDLSLSGYYGLIGYNGGIDETDHIFGGDMTCRIADVGIFSFLYDRQRLDNNSTVIREHFHRNRFFGRIGLDLSRRLKLGIEHTYAFYSDDNSFNEPGLDVLYYLSFDPERLTVEYRYFYREFADKVPEYFSPKGFSTHRLSFNWRHFLNKEEIFFGANDIYYDLRYDISVDSTEIVGHKLSWKFYYDITKRLNFNVSGSVMGSSNAVYEESEFRAGIKYYF